MESVARLLAANETVCFMAGRPARRTVPCIGFGAAAVSGVPQRNRNCCLRRRCRLGGAHGRHATPQSKFTAEVKRISGLSHLNSLAAMSYRVLRRPWSAYTVAGQGI
jgi:hypothetical protein